MTQRKINRGRIYSMKFLCRFYDTSITKVSLNHHKKGVTFALVLASIKKPNLIDNDKNNAANTDVAITYKRTRPTE